MAQLNYHFNAESLSFHKIEGSFRMYVKNIFSHLGISLIIGIILSIVAMFFIDTPKETLLRRQNATLQLQYEFLNKRMNHMTRVLEEVQTRDNDIYREFFNLTNIPSVVRKAGFGGADRYSKYNGFPSSRMLIRTVQQLDILTKQLYVQSQSYNEIVEFIQNKERMLVSIPSLPPIHHKNIHSFSPFGMRFHPILRYYRMHEGVDLCTKQGTPIHAASDGTVIEAEFAAGGFGYVVKINHGFGYETVYAHASKLLVQKGQRVKRGEVIALVGSTGLSSAPHLHYEVHKNGIPVNPINFYSNDLSQKEYERLISISSSKINSEND